MRSRCLAVCRLRIVGAALVLAAGTAPAMAQEAPPSPAAAIEAVRAEAAALEKRLEAEPLGHAQALEGVAARAAELNEPEANRLAEELLRQALALRERVLGPVDFSLVPTLEKLSTLSYDAGNWASCETLVRRVLALRIA